MRSVAKDTLFRRLLRWVPAALILAVAIGGLSVILQGGLGAVAMWYLLQIALPAVGLLVLIVTLYYGVRTKRWRSGAVQATLLLSLLALSALAWTFGLLPITYPASVHSTEPAATVRLPADGPMRVAWGGDSVHTNYHATSPDQRWAYDLVMEPYLLEDASLDDYGCYGLPVLAPADGTVAVAIDGLPDEEPGVTSNNIENPAGNHVAILLDDTDTYLLLAHLKPGTVMVEIGDRVTEGQRLAECGNSGNTSEPHIHIHHQRQNPEEFPIGFAEGLPLFFRDHDGPAMPVGGLGQQDGRAVATGDTVQHVGGE